MPSEINSTENDKKHALKGISRGIVDAFATLKSIKTYPNKEGIDDEKFVEDGGVSEN